MDLRFLRNREYIIQKYGNIPLYIYGYRDGMFFFIGKSSDRVSFNLGIRFQLPYEDIVSSISKEKPIRISHQVFNVLDVFYQGRLIARYQ